MNQFNYKKRNLRNGFHLLGFLLLLSGLFVLASPLFIEAGNNLQKTIWVGATSIILGMVILNIYEGTEINFNTHKLRDYFSFCGIKTGQWKELPQVEDIKIVPIEQKTTNIPNGISPTFYNIRYSYEVLLFFNADTPVYTFSYFNKSVAVKKAKLLSEKLLIHQ